MAFQVPFHIPQEPLDLRMLWKAIDYILSELRRKFSGNVGRDDLSSDANDHGSLSGLADDDHTQYPERTGIETLTGDWTFTGGGRLKIDGEIGLETDFITERTAAAGVRIDGLQIRDSGFALGSDAAEDIYVRRGGVLARIGVGAANRLLKIVGGLVSWGQADHTELTGVTADQHHAQDHKARHVSGGADAFASTDLLEALSKRIRESGGADLAVGSIADQDFLRRSGTSLIGTTSVSPHKSTHVSGGSDAFVSTDLLDAVVKRLRETSGPTDMLVDSVPDGTFLRRSGTALVGATPAGLSEVKVGTYTGDGTDNRNIVIEALFQPDVVIVHHNTTYQSFMRFRQITTGDQSSNIQDPSANPNANFIQAINTDGFQVGTAVNVNESGRTYGYIAWKQRA